MKRTVTSSLLSLLLNQLKMDIYVQRMWKKMKLNLLFKAGSRFLSSRDVSYAIEPLLMELRKERFRNVVNNWTYSVCSVVEGLLDVGNVSVVFFSADALGFHSAQVVSLDNNKRCLTQSELN
ncbi:hypothetical protein QVD17_19811 [Tagetes erecta]|uniref:Uncharacterized protein n=1 Tax=Tagetes erecta TaxID=13708 RepID=A0AAD8KNQ8_TARER|nr:hypothetical protein QVD17_19811 [Tagetes erecta]